MAIKPSLRKLALPASLQQFVETHMAFNQAIHKILRRIAPIRDNPLKDKAFQQTLRLAYVVSLPRAQTETQRITQTICRHMDFAAKTTTTTTQSLLLIFFGRRQHRDVPEQSYCQLSRFPYPGHRQELPSCVAKSQLQPGAQSVCKLNSIFSVFAWEQAPLRPIPTTASTNRRHSPSLPR